uniref:hypothetical protein n=1 Tax=Thiolapillus sp. TaxID=2017437 RepID=UPI003AF40F88
VEGLLEVYEEMVEVLLVLEVKWLLMNNHTSLGRLGSAALVGSQPRRRTTPNRNPRVSGMLDRLDM